MQESTSKEKILKKIRKALIQKNDARYVSVDHDSPIYPSASESLDLVFAEAFVKTGGHFFYCDSLDDLSEGMKSLMESRQWEVLHCFEDNLKDILSRIEIPFVDNKNQLSEMKAAVTTCENLVARTGTVMMSSAKSSGRKLPAFTPAHVVVASTNQLVFTMDECLEGLKAKYGDKMPSLITAITGPSRTADIEKTLIIGAHGPKEVFLFLLDAGKA